FDTFVASRIHALSVNAPAVNRLILPADHCIMEVKADDRVPEWATSLLARYGCQLNRVSKYCAGVAQLHGLKVLPLALSPGVPLPLEAGEGGVPSGTPPPALASLSPAGSSPRLDPAASVSPSAGRP